MTDPMDPKKETLRASLSARIKKSRGYFWSVFPWPEQFFEREDDLDPIASDLMVSITSIILFALCAAAFGYTYLFFSDPSQHTLDQIVSAQTSIDGYTCKPMGPDKWYDLNWTYAECVGKVRPLTADNVVWPADGKCGAPPNEYTCNCPPGKRITYNPFGDLQRRKGVAPKAAEKRTMMGVVDYPAAVALGATCPDPEFSPMDNVNQCSGVTLPAYSDADDTYGVGLRCDRWSGGNIDRDWALEYLKDTIDHFTDPDLGVCEFTLNNVPYECVKEVPMDAMTILALANNNAATRDIRKNGNNDNNNCPFVRDCRPRLQQQRQQQRPPLETFVKSSNCNNNNCPFVRDCRPCLQQQRPPLDTFPKSEQPRQQQRALQTPSKVSPLPPAHYWPISYLETCGFGILSEPPSGSRFSAFPKGRPEPTILGCPKPPEAPPGAVGPAPPEL